MTPADAETAASLLFVGLAVAFVVWTALGLPLDPTLADLLSDTTEAERAGDVDADLS